MATTPPLALSNIVDITVTVSPSAPAVNSFNVGLFVGPSTVIPSYGANSRVQIFTSTTAMLAAGFTTGSPEYIAAQIYFSQTPAAAQFAAGRQDLTALQTIAIDGRTVTDGAITTGTDVLDSATANFQSGDIGSTVIVEGAGAAGAALVTTIASVTNDTTAVLAVDAETTVTAAQTSIGATGSGYAVNDLATVTQGGGSYGTVQVLTVGSSGQVLTAIVAAGSQGTGYTTASALSTVAVAPSTGTGLKVNITAVGESLLQAATACRAASSLWYGLAVNAPVDADNLAISEWADPLWQTTRYYPYSGDNAIPAGTADNIALQLQTLDLRVLGQYATTQNGLYPNNVYVAAALMGVEMGLNTGLAGSFFTTAHKTLAGIAPEPLTQSQYTSILAAGFNVYANFGAYQLEEPGIMSNAAPSYLWLFLAMYVAQLQSEIMAVLQDNPAVPQTNAGEQLLLHAANAAGTTMAAIGFLAANNWTGAGINIPGVVVAQGQAIPNGFLNLAQPYSQQTTEARDAGQAMPIYSFITTAGAVLSLTIGVYTML
jgi:hypothetical protein